MENDEIPSKTDKWTKYTPKLDVYLRSALKYAYFIKSFKFPSSNEVHLALRVQF